MFNIYKGGSVDGALKNKIEKRAYEIFLHRGALQGYHFDDWVKAEKEIMAEIAKEKSGNAKTAAASPAPKKTAAKKK